MPFTAGVWMPPVTIRWICPQRKVWSITELLLSKLTETLYYSDSLCYKKKKLHQAETRKKLQPQTKIPKQKHSSYTSIFLCFPVNLPFCHWISNTILDFIIFLFSDYFFLSLTNFVETTYFTLTVWGFFRRP